MGRYTNHITHSFSTDPSKPTFDDTIQTVRKMILRFHLEKLTPEEREYTIRNLREEGYIS